MDEKEWISVWKNEWMKENRKKKKPNYVVLTGHMQSVT